MSTVNPSLPAIERGSDLLNPILVKETRQALKSRQFVATFLLMLIASWVISVFGILLAGAGAEYKTLGGGFFVAYYFVLAVAAFIVVPFGAFRSLLAERDQHTWEVLSITTLKPRQIVWGKLLSAMVQIFIYYSAITPFMAFAILLKGIDVPTIAVVLVASLFWSLALSMIGLTVSTFGSQRYWQVFLTLAVLGGLLLGMFIPLSMVSTGVAFFEFDSAEFWWTSAVVFSLLAGYCVLCLQIAIGQLTFDADNRTTTVRLAASGIFWLGLAWIFAGTSLAGAWGLPAFAPTDLGEFLRIMAILISVHWLVVGLFTVTESDVLSRRVRRSLVKFGPFRVLLTPLLPGGARGLIYLTAHLVVLFCFVAGLLYLHAGINDMTIYFVGALCAYLFIYLGLGSAIGRLARRISGDFRPAHARVTTVLLIALGSILPHPLYFFDQFRNNPPVQFWITDPFSTLYRIYTADSDSSLLMLLLAAGVCITLTVNLRAMVLGIIDVARPPVARPPLRPMPASATHQMAGAGGS